MKRVIFFIFFNFIYAKDVAIAIKNINYNERITSNKVILLPYDKKLRCKSIDISEIDNKYFVAKHYIMKGKPICQKDIKLTKKPVVRVDFGGIIIEKEGKIISKTKNYIKIKTPSGKIEKIYLNGQY